MSGYVFSVVSIATGYGLDGLWIKSQWGAIFSTPVHTVPGAQPTFFAMGTGSISRVKTAGAWRWPLTPSSVQVKERVNPYHCSLSEPSSPVLGWNLSFRCLHIMYSGNSFLYGVSHCCFIPLSLLLQGRIDLQVSSGATYKVWRRWFISSVNIYLISFRQQVPLWHVQELETSWVTAMAENRWDKKKMEKHKKYRRRKMLFKLSQGILKSISVDVEVGPWCGSVMGKLFFVKMPYLASPFV